MSEQDLSRRWLYRVRIQSHAVLLILSKHLNRDWDDEIRTFVRPFKPLIALHEDMKKSLAELERKWADQEMAESNMVDQSTDAIEKEGSRNETGVSSDTKLNSPAKNSIKQSFVVEDCVSALREMRCYVQFVEENVMTIRSHLARHTVDNPPKVRWDDLWCLFEPGQYIYYESGHEIDDEVDENFDECFICETDPEPRKGEYAMRLFCYYIDYDGQAFRPVFDQIDIEYYHGEKEVSNLMAYPLKFAREEKKIYNLLLSRGESFKQFVHNQRLYYSGRSIDNKTDARHYEGEVIIDFEEALLNHPEWTPDWLLYTHYVLDFPVSRDDFPIRKWVKAEGKPVALEVSEVLQKDYGIESMDYNNMINRDRFLAMWKEWDKAGSETTEPPGIDIVDPVLLPQRLLGYVLRERKFCRLDVRFLRPLRNQMRFDDLKINPENKNLIQSLVVSHFQRKRETEKNAEMRMGQDIIEGKADNLIILLHGVPGVGKTATAEAVANANQKPLFPITCGDLGLEPDQVETNLGRIFQLANRWNCVLLLDEADIFLADRKLDNLSRNALVSVFLRILEYYNGILILTTNRVGTLDEAFESRIHIMLYYPRLTAGQTTDIFRMNISRLKEIENQRRDTTGQPALEIDEDNIIRFAKRHFKDSEKSRVAGWNGCQIRNAFQIALAMARYDWAHSKDTSRPKVPVLDEKHFNRVASATKDFHNYLKEARGKDSSALAHEHSERADDFNIGPSYPDHWSPPQTRPLNRYPAAGQDSREYYRRGGYGRYDVNDRDTRYNHSHRSGYSPRHSPASSSRRERRHDSRSPERSSSKHHRKNRTRKDRSSDSEEE
ncbi:P-loop containing nucleoside triphosphate hydrolase protein [Xylaria flabelliformis]|nr:P-loop containing nucleoside triphosphate hydrolase protein [Xylaria flabelliformis]